jgi:hypothetical protein
MNATAKICAVIGLALIAGFACGYLFAGATAPMPKASEIGVELSAFSSSPTGELIVVSTENYTFRTDKERLQLLTNSTFVRENNIESWSLLFHNV